MKTLVLSVLALLSFSIIVAQETPVELEDVTVSSKNNKFLDLMQDEYTPSHAVELQAEAASYDLIRSPYYRGSGKSDYFIEFKTDNGSMYTTYDNKGAITRCQEKYRDIALPKAVRDQIFEQYDGWELDGNQYATLFKDAAVSKRIYKVKIKKGDDKKVVTIDLNDQE